jgi:predicted AAA+ superfamily ATPase
MIKNRYLFDLIQAVLNGRKMVFIGGPRQVGKSTLALSLLAKHLGQVADETHPAYLNWDRIEVARSLRSGQLPADQSFLIFDEIHKYAKWRNLVKGFYDTEKSKRRFIVTGSARLDYFSKGGDSLLGRYRYFRLHPFSLLEWSSSPTPADLQRLMDFGGFPEPLISGNVDEHRIWKRDRIRKVIREDLRDLENVKEISLIEHLVDLLPERVGSLLSVQSLRKDLEVDHKTVSKWLQILDRMYLTFRILPYGSNVLRAIKKESKLYFWDWTMTPEGGARFENLVASQLLKYCHWIEDTKGHSMEIRFVRDHLKRELDFVVLKDRKPFFAVECKTGSKAPPSHLHYFKSKLKIPVIYQIHTDYNRPPLDSGGIVLMSYIDWVKKMGFP